MAAVARRRRPGQLRPAHRAALGVAALTAALMALAAACWALMPAGRGGVVPGPHLTWWAVALLTAAGEIVVLHLQTRREAHAISLGELALVASLFFASPGDVMIGRTVGALLVFVAWRRQALPKVAFNAALWVAESSLALLIFHAVAGPHAQIDPLGWLAAGAATVSAAVLAAVAVSVVIAVVDGGMSGRELFIEIGRGMATAAATTVVALVGVHALAQSLTAAVPLAVTVALLLVGFRAYSALSERHLSLERLYRFTQVVTSTPEVHQILSEVLRYAREVLQADHAEVMLVPASSRHQPVRVDVDAVGRLRRRELAAAEANEQVWAGVLASGTPLLLPRGTRDAGLRAFLDHRGLRDAVLAPLRAERGTVGTLLVGDRLGEVRSFDREDVHLLLTVANHASMALQHGELVDRLRHDALHDSLTGLPNRVHLHACLEGALARTRAGSAPGFTLMILDLVGFKQINDVLGHHLGDLLLRAVASRMAEAVTPEQTVARLGGDEFAVLVPDVVDPSRAVALGQRLRTALEHPVTVEGVDIEVGVSAGICLSPEHGSDATTLLKRADAAMYEAKQSGSGLHVFETRLETSPSPSRLALLGELRHAINAGELEIFVQPQADASTADIVGVEALVRWRHPAHGLLTPDEFISLAERSALIRPLTSVVLGQAVALCGQWRRAGLELSMAVNLSPRSILDPQLASRVTDLLTLHGVPPALLTLEITESSVISDPTRTLLVLDRLHRMGVRLSIDDFGTGYSSLSYLRQLPVQEVKVDRSFVTAMRLDEEDRTIVRSIVDLGANLGLDVVAEGVEDRETWSMLADIGCTRIQGYHVARPMPATEFEPWLRRRDGVSSAGRAPRR